MVSRHCCDCVYWDGEPLGLWESMQRSKHWAIHVRIRCTHPKHFKEPKCNSRKACKYFEQREVTSVIIQGRYPADYTEDENK